MNGKKKPISRSTLNEIQQTKCYKELYGRDPCKDNSIKQWIVIDIYQERINVNYIVRPNNARY